MQTSSRPSVLFIDDDQGMCETFELFFEDAGWQYTIASDGVTGLEYALSENFDLVITDLVIPGLGGLDLVKEVHKYKPQQAFVVVSGAGTIDSAISALREGAIDFVRKPINFENLRSVVYRITSGLREEDLDNKLHAFMKGYEARYELVSRDFLNGTPALPIIGHLFAANLIDNAEKLRLTLAYQEAVTNSVDHGNLELTSKLKDTFCSQGLDNYQFERRKRMEDPIMGQRKIYIASSFRDYKLTIEIRDNGKGFDPPTAKVNREDQAGTQCYGRGLTIIFGAMEQVEYRNHGREIVMTKTIRKGEA